VNTKFLVLIALEITFGYAYGRSQEQSVPAPWNIQAITYDARPEKILGGSFKADSCVPEASICMLSSTTKFNKLTVSVFDRSDLFSHKESLIKDGGYDLKDESDLGEGAFSATKGGGEIIEIFAPKGKKAISVRFVYCKDSGLRELRAFTARLLGRL
jgi:hypothetical protein